MRDQLVKNDIDIAKFNRHIRYSVGSNDMSDRTYDYSNTLVTLQQLLITHSKGEADDDFITDQIIINVAKLLR